MNQIIQRDLGQQQKLVLSLLLTAACMLLCLSGHPARAAEMVTLVLNDTNDPPFTTAAGDGFVDIVAGEAFRRAGYQLKLIKLPPERGLVNANAGIDDGDLSRIEGLEKNYPNLVRVPEKLMDWHFVAFARNKRPVANWDKLETFSLGHVKGWKIFEQNVKSASHRVPTDTPEQLFAMLDKDRIDVVLYERWMGQALIRQMDIQGVRVLEPPLAVRGMFIYMNRKHADKVPAIAAALRSVKADGTYTRVCMAKLPRQSAAKSQCEVN